MRSLDCLIIRFWVGFGKSDIKLITDKYNNISITDKYNNTL